MIQHWAPAATLAVLMAGLPADGAAMAPSDLRLVHQDEFSIVFMRDTDADGTRSDGPTEVMTWAFFDKSARLTRAWGWDGRISRVRIDCDAGQMAALHHQTFVDLEPVEEVTPPYRMGPPIGVEKAAVLNQVCRPQAAASVTTVADFAAARAWADSAYLDMKTAAGPQPLATPALFTPVWSYALTPEFVPATSQPPALTRPATPVDTWWWQFLAEETETQDTLATHVRIDCAARTYTFLSHATVRDGQITGTEPAPPQLPVSPVAGSAIDGLIVHVCDPDPDRPVRRYTNYFTARETLDEYFAGR
tara:strand:- start:531 stop:1445 length:915 start_codon:yes stop_codon:yes gene_type:complete